MQGVRGLFQGIVPRVMLGIWQTLFMVTGRCSSLLHSPGNGCQYKHRHDGLQCATAGAKLVQDALLDMGSAK